ncbi:hypothetical protein KY289_035658 [Solanum tuberosum]|nr:hypothetical protein KY289_035658 [Solanum tuberosum]
MSRLESRYRYPGSASCTSLIQLSTPESVFCSIRMLRGLSPHPSQDIRGFIDSQTVSAELRKPGQGFTWDQQWSPGAGPAQAVSLHLQRMANDEHLHKAFSYFDKDGNGYIEPDELRDALMEDGADDCTNMANDIFQEVDTDKDGRISFEEFAAMMKTGTDWRKASRHYSRGRFNSLSVKLMKDGSINLGNE